MFYDKQPLSNREEYKGMLKIIGQLSNLFSESDCPYLAYRAHENIFCKYLEAENLARSDCSADAKKDGIGIGLKTWMGNDDQKVAEFGKLKKNYAELTGMELVKKIAEYRNERIRVTKKLHGIQEMIYHVVKRVPNMMQILECAFDFIDIDAIELISNRGNDNNTYFTDGKHTYHFSVSKNTLYMIFDDLELLDSFEVGIMDDPYMFLLSLTKQATSGQQSVDYVVGNDIIQTYHEKYIEKVTQKPTLCLPLYSRRGADKEKFVAEKSGLNQWNAAGRVRDANELYIPYQAVDRQRDMSFFPPRDTPFTLHLPDGTEISAKVCQEADKSNPLIGKAIMSNPNKVLGKWLLRDVFELEEGTIVTYEMLELFGVDSVIFTKNGELDYSVDFAEIGTYERFYGEED
ncbi:MAG: hypothetical protein Q4D60_11495 [Eubacteriales bacterium]|nr:hypothetical protein [Eubacteriales bacterium]